MTLTGATVALRSRSEGPRAAVWVRHLCLYVSLVFVCVCVSLSLSIYYALSLLRTSLLIGSLAHLAVSSSDPYVGMDANLSAVFKSTTSSLFRSESGSSSPHVYTSNSSSRLPTSVSLSQLRVDSSASPIDDANSSAPTSGRGGMWSFVALAPVLALTIFFSPQLVALPTIVSWTSRRGWEPVAAALAAT